MIIEPIRFIARDFGVEFDEEDEIGIRFEKKYNSDQTDRQGGGG